MQEYFHKIDGSVFICRKYFRSSRDVAVYLLSEKRENYLRIEYAYANKTYHFHHR